MVKKKTGKIKEEEDINMKVEKGTRGRVSQRRRGGVGWGDGVFLCVHASDSGMLTGGGDVWNAGVFPGLDGWELCAVVFVVNPFLL